MRAILARTTVMLALVVGCSAGSPPPTPAPVPAPTLALPTATPIPIPTSTPNQTVAVDPLAAIIARQAQLQTFRQSLVLDIEGVDPAGQPKAMKAWAEGESARPNSSLRVGSDALGIPTGFNVIQADGRVYFNPLGAWLALDAQAVPAGMPLVPIPVPPDPQQMLPLLVGAQVTPVLGVSVRGATTDVLRVSLPADRADLLANQLFISQTVTFLEGTPTYTDLTGEVAVGRDDGFLRRIAFLLRGYSGGDPARVFSIHSQTELWDINDPTIAVSAPTESVINLPAITGFPVRQP